MTPLTRDDTEHGKEYVLLSEAIAEFERVRAMIADDAWACTFQTLGQYRSALLRECGLTQSKVGDHSHDKDRRHDHARCCGRSTCATSWAAARRRHERWCCMRFPGVQLDEFGGTSWQGTLCALTLRGVEDRLGPPHVTGIGGKCAKWWGFRCGDVRFTVYDMDGYADPHIGGTSLEAVWFAMALLRVPSTLAWVPVGVPSAWWGELVNCDAPRKTPNDRIDLEPTR